MGKYASELVKQAKAWMGAVQYGNKHKEILSVYNNHLPLARGYKMKDSDFWCACFVSACAIKKGYTDIIPTEVSCTRMIVLFQQLGCWVENENRKPNVGDIVFYDWDDNGVGDNKGSSDHVGIVSNVSRETFDVIEGNMGSGYVGVRTLQINGKYIRGFAVPKYDTPSETVKPSEPVKIPEVTEATKLLAREVIRGDWGNGRSRYEAIENSTQNLVNKLLGCNYESCTSSPATLLLAKEVIKGLWGNGSERYDRIQTVTQEYVNVLLRG